LGDGSDEGDLPTADNNALEAVRKLTSLGYTRNLLVIKGNKDESVARQASAETAQATGTDDGQPIAAQAVGAQVTPADVIAEATAMHVSTEIMDSTDQHMDQVREARMKGYEGDPCGECGNFTLVRNGTCLKCNTCGATSGCS